MLPSSFRLIRTSVSNGVQFLLVFSVVLTAAVFSTGCGGGGTRTVAPIGNTAVTLLASSTANDQVSQFKIYFNSVTLADKAGNTVTLFTTPQSAEFMHLNGSVEPLINVSIPQGTYISATASIEHAYGTCLGVASSGGLLIAELGGGTVPASAVTVNMPEPIVVTGTSMGLVLDLQVSKSTSLSSCDQNSTGSVSVTPTFNLTPLTVAAQPTNSTNGMTTGLEGMIGSIDGNGIGFSVTAADGPVWHVSTDVRTQFQGVTGMAQLGVGMPVDMDAAIQQDGSLVATRVAVYDSTPSNLTISSGPVLQTSPSTIGSPYLMGFLVENQGLLRLGTLDDFNYGNAVFQTSPRLTNVQSLPFAASFNATNMVSGQNVFSSSHSPTYPTGANPTTAAVLTLLPQTINGRVNAVSTSGGFTTYAVALAAYAQFPLLGAQPSQSSALISSDTVVVYVDSNTQMLNSEPISVGSMLRFNGLVFNDNGTLRMDCARINDGVTE